MTQTTPKYEKIEGAMGDFEGKPQTTYINQAVWAMVDGDKIILQTICATKEMAQKENYDLFGPFGEKHKLKPFRLTEVVI